MHSCCQPQAKVTALVYEHERLLKTTELMGEHLRPAGALAAFQKLEKLAVSHGTFDQFLELSRDYRQLYRGLRYTTSGHRKYLPQAAKPIIEDALRAADYLELELRHELSRRSFSDEELVHRLLEGSSTP